MDSAYQVGPWEPPNQPVGQTSAAGKVKTPSRIKKGRAAGGWGEGGMEEWEKKEGE